MSRTAGLARRLNALILTMLLVVGTIALPDADALLDHGLAATRHASHDNHLEGAGGCQQHADHCVLNGLLNALRLQAPGCGAAKLVPVVPALAVGAGDSRALLPAPFLLHHSRAPPSLRA